MIKTNKAGVNAGFQTKLTLVASHSRHDEENFETDPELSLYRDRTLALLRRYCQLSVELGRVPSLLGREFFRSRVTSYRMHNFEDVVIFVHDVERCLERLDDFSRQVLARVALQEYTQHEAAGLLGCTTRTVERRYPEALDRLTDILLEMDLLRDYQSGRPVRESRGNSGLPPKKPVRRVMACQEPETIKFAVNSSFHDK